MFRDEPSIIERLSSTGIFILSCVVLPTLGAIWVLSFLDAISK